MLKASLECQFCSTLNLVDLSRHDHGPKCGECGKPFLLDRPVQVTEGNFDKLIEETSVPVIVDFYADWCGPCRVMAPVLDQIAQDRVGSLLVAKINTDQSPELCQRFGIRSIPYFARFEQGKKVDELVGTVDADALKQFAA